MYHKTTYSSGEPLWAGQIENPTTMFEIEWEAPALRVHLFDEFGLEFEAGTRWARVLAETEAGAIQIAQYHHPSGDGFRLRVTLEYVRNIYGPHGIEIEEIGGAYVIYLNSEEIKRVPVSEGAQSLLKTIDECAK